MANIMEIINNYNNPFAIIKMMVDSGHVRDLTEEVLSLIDKHGRYNDAEKLIKILDSNCHDNAIECAIRCANNALYSAVIRDNDIIAYCCLLIAIEVKVPSMMMADIVSRSKADVHSLKYALKKDNFDAARFIIEKIGSAQLNELDYWDLIKYTNSHECIEFYKHNIANIHAPTYEDIATFFKVNNIEIGMTIADELGGLVDRSLKDNDGGYGIIGEEEDEFI